MRTAVLGAGRVGTSLAIRWRDAGHPIVGLSGRDATPGRAARYLPGVPVMSPDRAAASAEIVVLAVPDAAIARLAADVAPVVGPETWLLHVSGATGLDALGAGPRRLGVHPLQTFPDVAPDRLSGCAAAVSATDEEGAALGERLARDAGAVPFRLDDRDRPLYHAAAVFASNHVVATSAFAERLFAAAGVPDPLTAMAPLQRATVDNVASLGPADALTGPAVRGDVETIRANLGAVAQQEPAAVAVYVALCRAMLDLAVATGRLDVPAATAAHEALGAWT